jgi:hypothetical protein
MAEQGTGGRGGVECERAGEQCDRDVVVGYFHGVRVQPTGAIVFASVGSGIEHELPGTAMDGGVEGKAGDRAMVIDSVASVWDEPKTMRIGEERAKGYVFEEFTDVFRRYIPIAEVEAMKEEMADRAGGKKETASIESR